MDNQDKRLEDDRMFVRQVKTAEMLYSEAIWKGFISKYVL